MKGLRVFKETHTLRRLISDCIMATYSRSNVKKADVPEGLRPWSSDFIGYDPPYYVSPSVLSQPSWADPESTENIKFNQIDGEINRKSLTGVYDVVNGRPRNPLGRIGIAGRGYLGKWGPNHAAEIIIYKLTNDRRINFVCITRKNNGVTAFPGGMVDNGETFVEATIREAMEEIFDIPDYVQREQALSWLKRNIPKADICRAANIMGIPIIVTEQCPEKLGKTVDIINPITEYKFSKTLISMITDEVKTTIKSKLNDRHSFVLFGIESHACIQQTALDLREMEYDVHLVGDGISSRKQEDIDYSMKRMEMSKCFITSYESVLFSLLKDAKNPLFKEIQKIILSSN